MTSNGKQFTVTREMLTAVAGVSARYSKFAFVLFCYITNHLMTGPLGNSEFCFPRISMFPSTSSRETLRFSGNKIHCSPRDQSLSVYYYMASSMRGQDEPNSALTDIGHPSWQDGARSGSRAVSHKKTCPKPYNLLLTSLFGRDGWKLALNPSSAHLTL